MDDDKHDDLITLRGGGQITQWKFPENIKNCPIHNCDTRFAVRSDAIEHFKQQHTGQSIYCSICDKPIATSGLFGFKMHYFQVHPNEELPEKSNDGNQSIELPEKVRFC